MFKNKRTVFLKSVIVVCFFSISAVLFAQTCEKFKDVLKKDIPQDYITKCKTWYEAKRNCLCSGVCGVFEANKDKYQANCIRGVTTFFDKG